MSFNICCYLLWLLWCWKKWATKKCIVWIWLIWLIMGEIVHQGRKKKRKKKLQQIEYFEWSTINLSRKLVTIVFSFFSFICLGIVDFCFLFFPIFKKIFWKVSVSFIKGDIQKSFDERKRMKVYISWWRL